jgi:hypothetical protein
MPKTVSRPRVDRPSFVHAFEFPSVGALLHEECPDDESGFASYSIETTLTPHGDLCVRVTRYYSKTGSLFTDACGEIRIEHFEEVPVVAAMLQQMGESLPKLLAARQAMLAPVGAARQLA